MQSPRAARVYAALLVLYPRAYREQFGGPMRDAFADEYRDRIARGERVGIDFWSGVVADLYASVAREWSAAVRARGARAAGFLVGAALLIGLFVHGGWFTLVGFGALVAGMSFLLVLVVGRRLRWRVALAVTLGVAVLLAVTAATGGQGANASTPWCSTPHATTAPPPPAPVTAPDYFALGDNAYDRGDCAAAIAAYSQAITLDPQFAEAYNNRAYTYMMQDDYAHALPDLDQAIALRPNYVHALMNRGDIYNYYYHIDHARAVRDYDRILAQGPAARQGTSVCGHRLLAQHNGWNLGTLAAIIFHGPVNAGCED